MKASLLTFPFYAAFVVMIGGAAYVLRVAVPPLRVKTSTLVKYVGAFRNFFLEQPKYSKVTEHLPAKIKWPP